MSRTISITEETYNRLQAIAIPFEDNTPEDVIIRLLDERGLAPREVTPPNERITKASLTGRQPRERGATIKIADQMFSAVSVPDLYLQVMQWLFIKGYMQKLDRFIPFQTSQQRYLIAKKPIHPKGNDFVSPVEYKEYYMEAHKNYDNAITSLTKFLSKIGITVEYLANG